MSGTFLTRNDRDPGHYCDPPDFDEAGLDSGTYWRCECGHVFTISSRGMKLRNEGYKPDLHWVWVRWENPETST